MSTSSRPVATVVNAVVVLLLASLVFSLVTGISELRSPGFKIFSGVAAAGAVWYLLRVVARTVRYWGRRPEASDHPAV